MCGIFGQCCQSQASDRFSQILCGLSALQYRGYDSCGIAWNCKIDDSTIQVRRAVGAIDALRKEVPLDCGCSGDDTQTWCCIGHTRWATHGDVTLRNTHPHRAGGYAIVHNGVVDNAEQLRQHLRCNHSIEFASETDTEIIVQLIALQSLDQPLAARVANAMRQVRGANAVAVLSQHEPDQVALWRRGSPLVVGLCDDDQQPRYFASSETTKAIASLHRSAGPTHATAAAASTAAATAVAPANTCFTFASDATALQNYANRALILSDNDIAILDAQLGECYVFYGGKHPRSTVKPIGANDGEEGDSCIESIHDDYNDGLCMWREMHEQPVSQTRAMAGRICRANDTDDRLKVLLGGLQDNWYEIETAPRLVMIACGTSYHAALAARPLFERYAARQVVVERATPLVDRQMPIFRGDACFFLSQSGETADTLAALRYCKQRGALCVGIVNTVASSIARLTECGLYLKCGPEIGVASTKAYTSQICVLAMIAAKLCANETERQEILRALRRVPDATEKALLASDRWAQRYAAEWRDRNRCVLLARGSDEATCYEAALKIKELCYVLAEGCHAGELKHGPLALVDQQLPIIAFAGDGDSDSSELVRKMNTAIEQVAARHGNPVVIASGQHCSPRVSLTLPSIGNELLQCVVNIVPMQLLAFYWAVARDLNVDRPRNLAKSVTVQ